MIAFVSESGHYSARSLARCSHFTVELLELLLVKKYQILR